MKQNKPYIIGLTGTIGSGKSTCTNYFKKLGIPVIDADAIAYKICEPKGPGLVAIEESFGKEYILPDGTYNRELMRKTVQDSPEALDNLNSILHPIIKQEKENQLELYKDSNLVIYDCPLLFEIGEDEWVNESLVITVDDETRMNRLMIRDNISVEEAERRSAIQLNENEKLEKADTVIYNNATIDALEETLTAFLKNKNFL